MPILQIICKKIECTICSGTKRVHPRKDALSIAFGDSVPSSESLLHNLLAAHDVDTLLSIIDTTAAEVKDGSLGSLSN